MNKILFLTALFILTSLAGFGQEDRYDLGHDTLSLKGIIELQYENRRSQIKLFDTARIELYLGSRLIAALPGDMKKMINPVEISNVEYDYERLPDSRILQRIMMFIEPGTAGREEEKK